MTSALILSLAIITSTPSCAAVDQPTVTPIVMSIEQTVASSDLVVDACPEASPVQTNLLAPLEPICTNWCNDQKVFCCADPNETCNYTCEFERIRCTWECRDGNRGGAY